MEILKVLSKLERMENYSRLLYEKFSRLFTDDKELSGIFYIMSLDEKSHVELVRYQSRLAKKSPDDFKDVRLDVNSVDEMTNIIKNVMESESPITAEDAVKLSVKIETDITESLYKTLMEQSNPDVARLLKSLGGEGSDHVGNIVKYALQRGWLPSPDD